jgi:S1-C subfamily serine protease
MLSLRKFVQPTIILCAVSFGLTSCTSQIDTKPVNPTPNVTAPPALSGGHGAPLGENTIADLAAEAMKSVVNIDTQTSVVVPSDPFTQFSPFGFFDEGTPLRKYEIAGTGTGVIYRNDGYILTNNHVVGKADKIKVTLNDNRVFSGRVVGRDPYTDLALVKIPATGLPVAKFGPAQKLRPGDFAFAIGSPAGLSNTVTLGIISALGRSLGELGEGGLIQTDTAINPGNSGGPLLNIHGEVVGINTAIRKDYQNIGFAIPTEIAQKVADQLLSKGSIQHPYVGISMRDLNDDINKALGLPAGTVGVVIAKVASGSPGDNAGLQTGDVITNVDGQPVRSAADVRKFVKAHQPGDTIKMTVARNGRTETLSINVGAMPTELSQQ